MAVYQGCGDEAEDRARKRDEKDLGPADLVTEPQHPGARNREGKAACDHSACAHDCMRDIRFVQGSVTQKLQEEEGDDSREDDGPGKGSEFQCRVDGRGRDDDTAAAADKGTPEGELPLP